MENLNKTQVISILKKNNINIATEKQEELISFMWWLATITLEVLTNKNDTQQ